MKRAKILLCIVFLTSILIPKIEARTASYFAAACQGIVLENNWTRITRCQFGGQKYGPFSFPNDAVIEGVDMAPSTVQFTGPSNVKLGGTLSKGPTYVSIVRGDYMLTVSAPVTIFVHERK